MMEYSILLITILFLIGFAGSFVSGMVGIGNKRSRESFVSGMVGIGGSIIKYPMLLYIPPLLGFSAFTSHEVAGISAVQVFFATIGGIWAYRKGGYLNKSLILYMGISILVGSLIGALGSNLMTDDGVNMVYAILATIAVIMMFIPKKGREDIPNDEVSFNRPVAAGSAFVVGIGAGIVGAAGAFILVPILLVVLKIPTRMAIATSLAVTFISSIGATAGKLITGQVLLLPAAVMVVASLLAASLGVAFGKKVNTKILQGILALLILATAIKMWIDIIGF